MTTRNPTFHKLLERMAKTHDLKSSDYARDDNPYSNFEHTAVIAQGFTDPVDRVFATLIGVKLARLGELRSNGKTPKNESIVDTHEDLAVYAALWAAYREEHP